MKICVNPCSIEQTLKLMKSLILLTGLIFITSCSQKKDIPEILQNKYETITIPNDIFDPHLNLAENHLKEILILLHNKFPEDKIKEHFGMTNVQYKFAINDLYGNGLIKKTNEDKFVPSCMVIDTENGNKLKKTADSLGKEMSLIAIDRLGKIKDAYSKIPAFKKILFDDASLFIIGNVAYNYLQIPFIEEQFLRAEAPRRGESRYYLALIEKADSKADPFGLYINRFQNLEIYTAAYYGKEHGAEDSIFTRTEFNGLLKEKNPLFPLIGISDQKKLKELAHVITPDIINYLEKCRTLFVKLYFNSVYKDQTSFREWFIWYYQFIVAQTNRTLIEKDIIKLSAKTQTKFVLVR